MIYLEIGPCCSIYTKCFKKCIKNIERTMVHVWYDILEIWTRSDQGATDGLINKRQGGLGSGAAYAMTTSSGSWDVYEPSWPSWLKFHENIM